MVVAAGYLQPEMVGSPQELNPGLAQLVKPDFDRSPARYLSRCQDVVLLKNHVLFLDFPGIGVAVIAPGLDKT